MRRLSQILMVIGLPSTLAAQVGPTAGNWGAEARTDAGGALLRFRSEGVAAVFGFRAAFDHDISFSGGDQTSLALRLGQRRYSRLTDKTRPYRTLSILASYDRFSTLNRTGAGVGAEFGAAHFFTPHVSIGASGELNATMIWTKSTTFSSSVSSNGFDIAFLGFRVFGGVYF